MAVMRPRRDWGPDEGRQSVELGSFCPAIGDWASRAAPAAWLNPRPLGTASCSHAMAASISTPVQGCCNLPRDRSDKQNRGEHWRKEQGKTGQTRELLVSGDGNPLPRLPFMIFWTNPRERLPVGQGRCRSSSSRFWRRRQSSSRSRGQHGRAPGR